MIGLGSIIIRVGGKGLDGLCKLRIIAQQLFVHGLNDFQSFGWYFSLPSVTIYVAVQYRDHETLRAFLRTLAVPFSLRKLP